MPDDTPKSDEHSHWLPSFGLQATVVLGVLVLGSCGLGLWLLSLVFREPLGPEN